MKKIFIVVLAVLFLLVVSSQVVSLFDKSYDNQNLSNLENDLIKVDIEDGDTVKNLSKVKGEARGYFYFEASFPAYLEALDGRILKTYIVQAQDEWMTEDFVPFSFVLDFSDISETEANLVFEKSNPSGMPENDFRYSIRVNLGK